MFFTFMIIFLGLMTDLIKMAFVSLFDRIVNSMIVKYDFNGIYLKV